MIIGFTGKMRTGKSTACGIVKDILPNTMSVNMKDGLVAEMRERLPDVLERLGAVYTMSIDELFTVKPPVMRALMQNYGTEVRRADDPSYWINKWKDTAIEMLETGAADHIVVDDVRFLNEAKAVTDMGGIIVRVVRNDVSNKDIHQSETEMDDIIADVTITAQQANFKLLERNLEEVIRQNTTPEEVVPVVDDE